MGYDQAVASQYEAEDEHALPEGEGTLWLAELRRLANADLTGRVLDIGAGTGLLTRVLKAAGLLVTGLEPSSAMIKQGLASHPDLAREDFVAGSADATDLFAPGTFDWIVCRQVLCHLTEPLETFSTWRRWIAPDGRLMLVDGFWPEAAWSSEALQRQPFAALSSAQPVAAMLGRAGFRVLRVGPFPELDRCRPGSAARYLVTAALGG
ncbi:MAG: class I SAM-dependent methyltransferase [Phenylobacterium sp.]|uniref:class I SAM-dependent methyltransferase n=1 Tax=Phenylobacterium sp. TaxID=1871053 RepID=UPI002724EF9C|nr:class I SAM-dependent methyltransferase [Phenylobacterium sp.]MDO8902522.1 class I SAM-dependent methyltransferase [Phenylobacterium sp.]